MSCVWARGGGAICAHVIIGVGVGVSMMSLSSRLCLHREKAVAEEEGEEEAALEEDLGPREMTLDEYKAQHKVRRYSSFFPFSFSAFLGGGGGGYPTRFPPPVMETCIITHPPSLPQ